MYKLKLLTDSLVKLVDLVLDLMSFLLRLYFMQFLIFQLPCEPKHGRFKDASPTTIQANRTKPLRSSGKGIQSKYVP